MDSDGQPVGLVVGTVAATPLQFSVAISPDQYLYLDDMVVTSRSLPGQVPVQVSGVVTNVEAVHQVAARLRRDAVRAGSDGAVRISRTGPASDTIIRSSGDLVELLEAELADDQLRADIGPAT